MIRAQFEYQMGELRAGVRAINRGSGRSGRLGKGALGWVLFVVLAALLFWLLERNHPVRPAPVPIRPPVQPIVDSVLLPLIPWALIFLFIWILVFWAIRRGGIGKSHPFLGRIWTLEADADLLTLSDATSRTERSWRAFQKFVETKDIFLLFTGPKIAVILPKRIFDTTTTDEFRRLAQTQITPPISGFPVIPLAERAMPPK